MYSSDYEHALNLEQNCKWREAAEQYEHILKNTFSVAILSKCGWCYSRAGEYEQAIKKYQLLINEEQSNPKWYYLMGYQYYIQNKWSDAVYYFDKALELNPKYFKVLYKNAYAYLKIAGEYLKLQKSEYWKALGLLDEAHKVWISMDSEQQTSEKHTYFNVNFLHGKALSGIQTHNSRAITYFKTALEIKEDVICRYNLSKTYYIIGDYENAWNNLPNTSEFYVKELKAYILTKKGDVQGAINLLNSLIAKNPKDYLFVALSENYLVIGQYYDAIVAAQKAIVLKKSNHKAYCVLAKSYLKLGLLKMAREGLERAISIKRERFNSDYEECHKLLNLVNSQISDNYEDDPIIIKKIKNLQHFTNDVGKIVKFFPQKKYGFISSKNNGDVFFHVSECNFEVKIGLFVAFVCQSTAKGVTAKSVVVKYK